MITIQPILAFTDNYIWLMTHIESRKAIIVDPGEAEPVLARLQQDHLNLIAILITHHHLDHTGGIGDILARYPVPVYGSAREQILNCTHPLDDNDQVAWPDLGIEFNVLSIPGHTHGHIAYYGHNSLFCGDTLFTGGCGRIFEGTALQLHQALERIAKLPPSTEIYCGHEYTLSNLRFAIRVEPQNLALQTRLSQVEQLRQNNLPTVPETLGVELATNPFLRCHLPSIRQAVNDHVGKLERDPAAIFAALRAWKNSG